MIIRWKSVMQRLLVLHVLILALVMLNAATVVVPFFVTNASAGTLDDELRSAALLGHTDEIKTLLDKGANIEAKNKYLGYTVLMEAAYHGNVEVVRLLLDKGANREAKNEGGWTALMLAASKGETDVVRLLLDKGADVHAKSLDGWTALEVASGSKADVVRLLLDKGADMNAKGNGGRTALMEAAYQGKEDVVRLLLDKGADIEAKTECCGWTALMYAADKGNLGVVRLLVDKGAKINVKNSRDEMASTIATEKGHADVWRILAHKSNPSEILKQRIADLHKNRYDGTLRKEIIMLAQEMNPAPEIPEAAKQNFIMAGAYMKAAKAASEYELAIDAYDAALLDAPWWGNAYYNLSVALDASGNHYRAKEALNLYLLTKPSEADKNQAQQKIYEIEAQQELQKRRETEMKAKYGGNRGSGFDWEYLFRYGAITKDMSFDASGNTCTISLKVVTRKEYGYLKNYFQIADITSRNDTFLRTFSMDWRGTESFYLDDRTTPYKEYMTLSVTSYGDGDANITIRPAGNASASIQTTLTALLRERACQAVYAGNKQTVGSREFYVMGQGGGKGSLLFFPVEIKGLLENGSVQDLMPKLVATVNYRDSDGTNKHYSNSDLGEVDGTHYHLEYTGSTFDPKPGRGEEH